MLISRLPQGGGKGELHGASITIEADISLAGQTVELYLNGAMVKSGTLHDDASYLFTDILEAGTYTAEAGGFSGSVEVSADDILSKSAKNLIIATTVPITLTLEGAKGDTITMKDKNGKPVGVDFVFNGATTCTQTVNIIDGEEYTFVSHIAKDITDGISDYSKKFVLTTLSNNLKIMPEGALYWYGNECVDVTGGWGISGYTDSTKVGIKAGEKLENSFLLKGSGAGNNTNIFLGTTNAISSGIYGKIGMLVTATNFVDNIPGLTYLNSGKDMAGTNRTNLILSKYTNGVSCRVEDVTDFSNKYMEVYLYDYNRTCINNIHAIWFE